MEQELMTAIKNKNVVKFDYVAKDLEITKDRLVLPIELKLSEIGTYEAFLGWDLNREGVRLFQLAGVQNFKIIYGIMVSLP